VKKLSIPVVLAPLLCAMTYATSSVADDTRPNRTLLSTGAGIFVVSYGASAFAGAVSDVESDKRLFVPIAGPWIALADRDCSHLEPCGNREEINVAMIVTSGVVQSASIVMAVAAWIVQEKTTAKKEPAVALTPLTIGAGAGIGALGRF
jgi:hypothetical protein